MPDISEQNIIFTLTQVYEDKAQQFDKDLENREKRVSLTNAMAKKALQEFGNVVKQQGVTASKVVGDIDKLFDKIGNKKFNNKSIDAEIKDLKELKNALIIAEKEYPKLSNESKKAYDKMVTEADQYIVAMNKAIEAEQELINKNSNLTASVSKTAKETKDLSNNLDKTKDKTKEAATTTGDLFDVIDLISPAFGRFGFQIQAVTRGLQAMTTNTGTLARALSFLKTPLGAIGTVAATVGTALTGAFLSSEEGADAFDKKLEGVKQRFRFFGSELSQFAVKLFQGQLSVKDFDFSNIFAQFDRIKKQANEAQATGERVSVLRDQLEEEQVNSIVEVAKKQAEAFELRDKYYGIENDNLDNITEKRSLLTQIEKKNSELSQIKIKEAETLLEIEKELLAVKGAGATTADKRKVAEAEVNLANEEKAAEQIKRFTTKQLVVLNNAKEAIEKETRDVLNTFADTIESNALSVKEFKTTVPPIEVDPEIQADEISKMKKALQSRADKISEELAASLEQLNKTKVNGKFIDPQLEIEYKTLEESAKKEILRISGLIDDLENRLLIGKIRANDKIKGYYEIELLPNITIKSFDEILKEISDKAIEKFKPKLSIEIKPEIKGIQEGFDDEVNNIFSRIFGGAKSGQVAKEALGIFNAETSKALDTFIEAELRKTDFLIEQQEKRISKLNDLAALGNAEQLQQEEERLNSLIEKRERFQKRQEQINQASALADTAATVAKLTLAIANAATTNIPLAIVESIALLAAIAGAVSQVRALSGFEEGIEKVGNNKRKRGSKDTVLAWIDPEERIIKGSDNKKLKGMSNEELVRRATADFSYQRLEPVQIARVDMSKLVQSDNSRLLKKIDEQNRLLQINNELLTNTKIDVKIHGESYEVKQLKEQKFQKIKVKLAR
jgi:hypothetical protein